MIDFADVKRRLANNSIVETVEPLDAHARIETRLLYPDGSHVDVFLQDENLLPPTRLTDFGQTTAWLLDLGIKPWLSRKRQAFLEDALRTLKVKQDGGALVADLPSLDELPATILRLAQACVRVADLTYTRRSSLQTTFAEDLEEVLVDSQLPFEPNIELQGRFGNVVRVDYLVRGRTRPSVVLGLSTGNSSQAHASSVELFSRWYDLDVPARTERRVTVYDDRTDVYRDSDLERLRNVSDVLPLSDRSGIVTLLAA